MSNLKQAFSKLPFVYYNKIDKIYSQEYMSMKSHKTGRTLSIDEIKANTPNGFEVIIFGDKFKFIRRLKK